MPTKQSKSFNLINPVADHISMWYNFKIINDAKRELGAISEIRDTFIGFQEFLKANR